MANDFDSVESFYSDLIIQLGEGLQKALEEAKTIAYEYIITNWYSKYPNPNKHTYDRLDLMTESLQAKYELNDSELTAFLYIKNDELHPASNSWNEEPVTYEYLYEWFAQNYNETGILEYTQEQMEQTKMFVNIIRDTLKSKGYDFE